MDRRAFLRFHKTPLLGPFLHPFGTAQERPCSSAGYVRLPKGPKARHGDGGPDGVEEAGRPGLPLTCNVVGRAVIHGGSNDGKAQRHVDGFIEVDQLDGDEPWS